MRPVFKTYETACDECTQTNKYNIRKGNCTRVLEFDGKSKQSTTKENGKRKISKLTSLNHLDETESWGKKEKQY